MDENCNPQFEQMAHESMVRNLGAQAVAIWPQERELVLRKPLSAAGRVLDAGCGTRRNLVPTRRAFSEATAVTGNSSRMHYLAELRRVTLDQDMSVQAAIVAHQLRNSSHTPRQLQQSVKEGLPVSGGSLLANRPEAAGGFVCKRLASGAGLIEIPHRFVEATQLEEYDVQIGLRLGTSISSIARSGEITSTRTSPPTKSTPSSSCAHGPMASGCASIRFPTATDARPCAC
jgi:hypothetical protein